MSNGINPRNLPKDRIATTDEQGKRLYVYPSDVKGRFRKLRNWAYSVLIIIFLVLPWIRINGHQALLLDVYHRRFAVFGVTFWAHEAPMLVFLFLGFVFTMGFITAIWGRLWCGWACPQTVFIDGVFRKIERLIEGDSVKRRTLDSGPLTPEKLIKKSLKWTAFILVGLVISHSFLAYFVGTETLFQMVRSRPSENWTSFLVMAVSSIIIIFDFGWFREQFCIIACPYGRFQSVLMDERSMAPLYDEKRGDCINCFKCVQVCPTGIDIRRGLQMECIACTGCIDACDEVMVKINKPKGLIRYSSQAEMKGVTNLPKTGSIQSIFRPRSMVYLAVLAVILSGFAYTISVRKPVSITVLRAKDTPYQVVGEHVINHFKIDLRNQTFYPAVTKFTLQKDMAEMGAEVISAAPSIEVIEGKTARQDFFVKIPKQLFKFGHAKAKLEINSQFARPDGATTTVTTEELSLVGPL